MKRTHNHRDTSPVVTVVGGGLAGSEAAWQLAERGIRVLLVEMRPSNYGPAHHSDNLAELVCSNSFKSDDPASASGTLKRELEMLGSLLLRSAREVAVPAGGALAVDRDLFSSRITDLIESHPNIEIQRREMTGIPDSPCVVASGPLTSDSLADAIARATGEDRLFFYDAAAPIVDAETLDRTKVFAQSRYDKGDGADYINCPMSRCEYDTFIDALLQARRVTAKDFESSELFSACQPVEEIARSGRDALRFGPLKPVGLTDPGTGERPWAVVQLRAENREASAYNLVGFQTNLAFSEQRSVFSLIPGLGEAEFLRYGVMHRNTYLDAPRLLDPTLALRSAHGIRFAGQITGTEGYLEAVATGLLCALNTVSELTALPPLVLPRTSALGALISYATDPETRKYQPMHVNWGIVPPLESRVRNKRDRYAAYARRALADVRASLETHPLFANDLSLLGQAQIGLGETDA